MEISGRGEGGGSVREGSKGQELRGEAADEAMSEDSSAAASDDGAESLSASSSEESVRLVPRTGEAPESLQVSLVPKADAPLSKKPPPRPSARKSVLKMPSLEFARQMLDSDGSYGIGDGLSKVVGPPHKRRRKPSRPKVGSKPTSGLAGVFNTRSTLLNVCFASFFCLSVVAVVISLMK